MSQFCAEQPDRFCIGHTAVKVQPEETHEAQAIHDLILHLIITQIVLRLQDQNHEHFHHIERSESGIAFVSTIINNLKLASELFPRNQILQCRKEVAVGGQIIKEVLYEKKGIYHLLSPALFRGYNNIASARNSFKDDSEKVRQLIEITGRLKLSLLAAYQFNKQINIIQKLTNIISDK